jgi:hypothetical protein
MPYLDDILVELLNYAIPGRDPDFACLKMLFLGDILFNLPKYAIPERYPGLLA